MKFSSNEMFKILDQHLPKSFITFDEAGQIMHLSQFAIEEFQTEEQFFGKHIKELFSESFSSDIENFVHQLVFSAEKIHKLEVTHRNKSLKLRWFRITCTRVCDEDDNFIYNLATLENITDIKLLNLRYLEQIQRFKQLESNARIGVWSYDLVTQKLKWSDEVYQIHKLSVGSKIDLENSIEFFYPYDQNKIQDSFELCLYEGISYDLELRIINKEQNLIWVRAKGEPIYKKGEIIGVYGTIQDITEKKVLEYNLSSESHNLEQYKTILDTFAIVASTDIHGKINFVNDNFCEISKYSRDELIGQDHRIVNSGDHPKEFFANMWNTIQSGNTWTGEIKNKAKDGSIYWVNTFITQITDNLGNCQGYMAIRFDITKEKELEISLEEERQRATINAQLASVGEMSTGIVHEINNPLAVIAGMNAMLPRKIKDEAAILHINKSISKAIERMYHIIKGLKRLSHKSEQEKYEVIPLIDLLEDSLSFIKESLKHHQIDFNLGDMPYDVVLECKEVEISQVLLNLVNNARDAIVEAESDEKWIRVSFVNKEKTIEIRICDSGPGIPLEIQDKIMEQFFTTKKVGKGTGLGLSLSSRIIKDHGGEMYLDKNADRTTFVIELPKKLDFEAA